VVDIDVYPGGKYPSTVGRQADDVLGLAPLWVYPRRDGPGRMSRTSFRDATGGCMS